MRKKGFLCIAVFLTIIALCMTAAADDEKANIEEALDRMLNNTYFALDTIESVNTDDLSISPTSGDPMELIYIDGERATSGSVEFVSGDEWMKDLVVWIDNAFPGEHGIAVAANAFSQPGEAVFHISAQSKSHTFDRDYTLRIIPYPQNAFVLKEGKELRIEPGKTYTERELIGMVAELAPETDGAVLKYFNIHGTASNGSDVWLTAQDVGSYYMYEQNEVTGTMSFEMANTQYAVFDVKMGPEPYGLTGPMTVYPGTDIQYEVKALSEGTKVPGDFVLTAEGADIDAEGRVTLWDGAKPGDEFTVTAASAEAGRTFTLKATIAENPLAAAEWTETETAGVTVPLVSVTESNTEGPNDRELWNGLEENKEGRLSGRFGQTSLWMNSFYTVQSWQEFSGSFRDLIQNAEELEKQWTGQGYSVIKRIYVNGCPVVYAIKTETQSDGFQARMLEVNGQIGRKQFHLSYNLSGNAKDGMPPFDDAFVRAAVSRLKIEGQPVEIMMEEPKPALSQADGITETSAGANVQYAAGEADAMFGKVEWSVTDAEGQPTKAVTIDKKGLVKTNRGLKEVTKVIVQARYEYCSEPAGLELTIYPAVKKIIVESTDTMLYMDSGHTVTLTAKADPEGAKLLGLNWTMNKDSFAELKDNGDGSVTLTPVGPGTLNVTVADAAGKKGSVKITVTDKPVTAVEIVMKGTPVHGKTVSLTAKLTPDKPAKRDVTWSVNVDESVATINAKGQLKIAKDAPAGTVITVTCTALGAAQPVAVTMDITVE